MVIEELNDHNDILLSLVPRQRLEKVLKALLSEKEFLSAGGIRSISKLHETPYMVNIDGQEFGLSYQPGESNTSLFGGNSNWRGPVWMPMNYLIVHALQQYSHYYKDQLQVEFPTGSGKQMTLGEISNELGKRLVSIFQKDQNGARLVNGSEEIYRTDPNFKDLVLFYEYFHVDTMVCCLLSFYIRLID